ncbi:MAG: glycosyltransferase family 4 protein, partial [Verrucomicrobiales bacterium]
MKIVQITPGAGGMYCGNCFRDNAMVREMRKQGHEATMLSLYLPMTLEEADQSSGAPIFFSGISVYLEQKMPLLGKMPKWLHKQLASPALLKWASGRAAKTRAEDLGELTLSMIKGEEGNQVRELDELLYWLKNHEKPDVISLSNVLLVGMARKLKQELGVPIVCMLQGEDSFLDTLPQSHRDLTWSAIADRCRDVDLFIPPSHYFGEVMGRRLQIPSHKIKVIYNGIDLDGYTANQSEPNPPVLGYFARMCREKGLDRLVAAFIELKRRNNIPGLKLHVGGGMGPSDEQLVKKLKQDIAAAVLSGDVAFFPNLDKQSKQQFFQNITLFSVPAMYGEAFGLYLLEAWGSGVPAVQPDHAAFPELIAKSGAGLIAAPEPSALADVMETLLLDKPRRKHLGMLGRKAVETE